MFLSHVIISCIFRILYCWILIMIIIIIIIIIIIMLFFYFFSIFIPFGSVQVLHLVTKHSCFESKLTYSM